MGEAEQTANNIFRKGSTQEKKTDTHRSEEFKTSISSAKVQYKIGLWTEILMKATVKAKKKPTDQSMSQYIDVFLLIRCMDKNGFHS